MIDYYLDDPIFSSISNVKSYDNDLFSLIEQQQEQGILLIDERDLSS
jgi:hypothetical protein